MIPWIHLDTATVPDGGSELRLMRRGNEFAILAGNVTLMSSRMSGSEEALAALACDRLRGRKNCHMLIGGYGMGFTLRAALGGVSADAHILVVELVPAVMQWARGAMAGLTGDSLHDPRVSVRETDVADVIAASRARFDAILLDVDNGPDALSHAANDRLYDVQGLHAARRALRPEGLLAVWSASPNKNFVGRLGRAGFAVEEIVARANKRRGGRHIVWAATKTKDR